MCLGGVYLPIPLAQISLPISHAKQPIQGVGTPPLQLRSAPWRVLRCFVRGRGFTTIIIFFHLPVFSDSHGGVAFWGACFVKLMKKKKEHGSSNPLY
ncbi:hypothetical protein M441DRAFT_209682 [Trichoderma asperellum CBS 433.97]|uniref:Uncharacterized protein n=1 Tax=Trichoderma asperellum (strain ATCC 204424 / CBS 433.97 / NBRC 101777) TaxID=1042311 RepID=A0A2T3ZMV6_TRIA4|nr:hypothetical protein M441DRAFT_209682 [Trichoderma asperellum CBS 433.97]PTB46127.1 hypothetical protein M441DRAFT_209682 [Trichoderma asperellum CBS 433.97]